MKTQKTDNKQVSHFEIKDMVTNEVIDLQVSFKDKPSFSFVAAFNVMQEAGELVMMTKWTQGEKEVTKLM